MATIDGLIMKALTEGANAIASNARLNAPTQRIKEHIIVDSAEASSGNYSITIRIPLKDAPEAGAYEFGSGVHSTRGPKKEYRIDPKNSPVLAIPRSRWPDFEDPVRVKIPPDRMLKEGRTGLLLRYVMHPGVEARPYMTPAIRAALPDLRKRFKSELVAAFVSKGKVEVIT